MNYDRLTLLVLAMALEDLIAYEIGEEIEISPTEDMEVVLYTAEEMLGKHPELLDRLLRKKNLEGWLKQIRMAKEDLVSIRGVK